MRMNSGFPAFPESESTSAGMTFREYAAVQIAAGMAAANAMADPSITAQQAVTFADYLHKALTEER